MATGRRFIILARHGAYDTSIEFPRNPDGHLNEKGQKQAAALAEHLQTMPIDAIYTSSLIRARETTDIIAARMPNVPMQVDERLQECIPNVPQGLEKLFAEIPQSFIDSGPAQASNVFHTYFMPIAEDAPNRTELIVSHGNLLGYLICRVFNAPLDTWLRSDFGNCCISSILVRYDGLMKLMYHNSAEHLPKELRADH